MKRRIFAFLLSVAMMISLIVPAYAETDGEQVPAGETTCDQCTVVDGTHAAECPTLTSTPTALSQGEGEAVPVEDLNVDMVEADVLLEEAPKQEESSTESITVGQQYIAQAEALLAQAEALDTDAEDLDAQCDEISDAIWSVVDEAQVAWEADEMTDEEMESLIVVANNVENVIEDKQSSVDEDVIVPLDTYTYTPGDSFSFRHENATNRNWRIVNERGDAVNTVSISGNSGVVSVVISDSAQSGTYYIQRSNRNGNGWSNVHTLIIEIDSSGSDNTEDTGKIKVYVYVSSQDSDGNSWLNNEEFQDLIGLYVCDKNNYFPAGAIELDASYLEGKENAANSSGAALINSKADWEELLAALSEIDSSGLSGTFGAKSTSHPDGVLDFSYNRGNSVNEYLGQASKDLNQTWGSQKSALFRWHKTIDPDGDTAHCGYPNDTTTKYHLDLCFNTNKITFITGNNDITSGDAKDGTTVDSRVYITGSEIQPPRNLNIPDGYRFMGYYEDADFTIPWDGIGTPLNEDQVVYIKITQMDNVVVHYVVAKGVGTVTPTEEAFNPVTGAPAGSEAAAGDGYVFAGWYADAGCADLLSEDAAFIPTAPDGGWEEGGTYYYYAKFEKVQADLTITKALSGIEKSDVAAETFAFTVTNGTESHTVKLPTSGGAWSYTLTDLDLGEWTITENADTVSNYSLSSTTVSGDAESRNASASVILREDKAYAVTFTNNYVPAGSDEEDVTFITVQKEFVGINENQIPADFTIIVKDSSGSIVATLKVTDSVVEKNGMVYTWKVQGLSAGEYTVEESGAGVTNFDLEVGGIGSVTTQTSNMSITQKGVDNSCNDTSKEIGPVTLIFAKLTKNEGYFVWSDVSLSANQRQAVATYLNVAVDKLHCYSGDKIDDADGLMFRGGTIRYDRDEGVVYFSDPKQWASLEWATYTMEGGINPEIDITNTYTPNTGALKIEKIVEKEYENDILPDDEYTFTVDVNGAGTYTYKVYAAGDENNEVVSSGTVADNGTLTLKGGQYAIVEDVPVGAYTVTETADDDYETEVTGASGTIASNETSEAIFTNTYKKHLFSLTITKAGVESEDAGAPFVFHVSGEGVDLDVVIYGNSSVTIKDLPIGTYTVRETSGYWRYDISAASYSPSSTVVLTDSDQAVTVINYKTNDSWLDAFVSATNVFKS